MLTRSMFFASLFAIALPACGPQTASATDDASLNDDAKADRTSGGSSYFLIRADAKGNRFVKRVNFATTTCSNGRSSAECSVSAVDYSAANLDDNDMIAVDGRPMIIRGSLGKNGLAAQEVWTAVSDSTDANGYAFVSDVVYRVKDNGVRCITQPCPSEHESKLNGTTARDVAIDLSGAGATDDQVSDAFTAMSGSDGTFVDGSNVVNGKSSTLTLVATNFFTRVAHVDGPKQCGTIAGLTCASNEWCDPTPVSACNTADVAGTCQRTDVFCSQIWQPVCGCDGKTYANDCTRIVRQVQLAHTGACAN